MTKKVRVSRRMKWIEIQHFTSLHYSVDSDFFCHHNNGFTNSNNWCVFPYDYNHIICYCLWKHCCASKKWYVSAEEWSELKLYIPHHFIILLTLCFSHDYNHWCVFSHHCNHYPPRKRWIRCISRRMTVTRFACIATRLLSSRKPMMYDSTVFWSASTASTVNRRLEAHSFTSRRNGAWGIHFATDLCCLKISRRAIVPGRYRRFFSPMFPVGALFRAARVAKSFLGVSPPVYLLTDVRNLAIWYLCVKKHTKQKYIH